MDGILNINKPSGMTSHDVVNLVRRLTHQRRVGHTGTLDPLAEGVLVVCLGRATKVVEFLANDNKTYQATITLGISTDTYDSEGRTVQESTAIPSAEQAEQALGGFRGEIVQVPPAFSAIKQGGQPLYKLARAGREVVASPRTVTIHELRLLDFRLPLVTLLVRCSKGTYVRSIAHDLGQRLGCGAHLSGLKRLQSGRFDLDSAIGIDDLVASFARGEAGELLFELDEALLDYDALILSDERLRAVRNGVAWLAADAFRASSVGEHGPVRVYSVEGEIAAMVQFDGRSGRWQPSKVF